MVPSRYVFFANHTYFRFERFHPDTALPDAPTSSPFTHAECIELNALLRDAHGAAHSRLVARILHRRGAFTIFGWFSLGSSSFGPLLATWKAAQATKTRLRRALPPFTLKLLLGAFAIALPLLLRARARTRQGNVIPGLAILAFGWPRSGGLLPRLCRYLLFLVSAGYSSRAPVDPFTSPA
jgi:hypothetical protein